MTLVTSSYTNSRYELHLPGSKMIKLIKIVYLHVIEDLYSSLVLWHNNTKGSGR